MSTFLATQGKNEFRTAVVSANLVTAMLEARGTCVRTHPRVVGLTPRRASLIASLSRAEPYKFIESKNTLFFFLFFYNLRRMGKNSSKKKFRIKPALDYKLRGFWKHVSRNTRYAIPSSYVEYRNNQGSTVLAVGCLYYV